MKQRAGGGIDNPSNHHPVKTVADMQNSYLTTAHASQVDFYRGN
jgi:hypothetical protein